MSDFAFWCALSGSALAGVCLGYLAYWLYCTYTTERWRQQGPRAGDECYFMMPNGGRQYGRVQMVFPESHAARIEFARLNPGGPIRLSGIYGFERLYPAGRPAYGKAKRDALQGKSSAPA